MNYTHSAFSRIRLMLLALICTALSSATLAQVELLGSTGGNSANPGTIFSIDSGTAATTMLGTPYNGTGLSGIATAPDGRLFAVASVNNGFVDTGQLLELDPSSGALISVIGDLYDSSGNGCAFMDISFHPNTGVLYALASNQSGIGTRCGVGGGTGGYLATINTSTAVYTILGRDASFGNNAGGIAFAPNGTLYFAASWDTPGVLYTLDLNDGSITSSTNLSDMIGPIGMVWHPDENLLYAGYDRENSNESIFTIDPATGSVTTVGATTGESIHGLAVRGQPAPPAPAIAVPVNSWQAMALMALVLAMVGGLVLIRRS